MAKTPKTAGDDSSKIEVLQIDRGVVRVCILGTAPLILNRMSQKAKMQLLAPTGRKTGAERATNLKHDPLQEYKDSVYRRFGNSPNTKTLLEFPTSAFKDALGTAALDIPGARKSQIGRLVSVSSFNVPIWGIPKMYMAVVRSADMNKTPDIRTRAIVEQWATEIEIAYIKPQLNQGTIAKLLAAAGMLAGVGDFRQEKGKGSFGQFELVGPEDPRFLEIQATGGAEAQKEAMENPGFYDQETETLYTDFQAFLAQRGEDRGKSGGKLRAVG
jgi:hypothetical protein